MADKSKNLVFDDLVARLVGMFGNSLPSQIARSMIQDAWREICNTRDWSFLRRKGIVVLPASGSGILASVTKFNDIVTINDAATISYLDNIPFNLVSSMGFVGSDGIWYQILRWFSATGQLVLTEPYYGETAADVAISFNCSLIPPPLVRVYVDLQTAANAGFIPDPDFNGFISVTERGNTRRCLQVHPSSSPYPPEYRNASIPTCLYYHPSSGESSPYYDATSETGLKSDSPLFKVFPTYSGEDTLVYEAYYRSTGGTFSDDLTYGLKSLPTIIPSEMLLARAAILAGIYAQTNMAGADKLNLMRVAQSYAAIYDQALSHAILRDDNIVSKDKLRLTQNGQMQYGDMILLDNRRVIIA